MGFRFGGFLLSKKSIWIQRCQCLFMIWIIIKRMCADLCNRDDSGLLYKHVKAIESKQVYLKHPVGIKAII